MMLMMHIYDFVKTVFTKDGKRNTSLDVTVMRFWIHFGDRLPSSGEY